MKKSLVVFGGVLGILMLVLGCGSHPPVLNINPDIDQLYAGYKGGASRNGYTARDKSIGITPLWQLKFKYPLFYSPSLAGNYIFQPGIDKKIHVIEVNTGVEIAEIKIRRPAGTTPELADSFMAICEEGNRSELLVFNYISGNLLWSKKTYKLCLPPALYDNSIFWVDGKNRVNAARLDNGEPIWSVKLESGFDCGPVIYNDHLFVTTRDNLLYSFSIEDGTIAWEKAGVGRTNSSPACYQDRLYYCTANGKIVCYDCLNGNLVWQYDDEPRLFYSPVVDDEGVYYGSGSGRFIKLDKKDGRKIWDYDVDVPIRGTAVLTAKSVIFSSLDGTVYLLDKQNGRVRESYVAEGMISAAPVIFDTRLFIAAQDKFLYCFYMLGENE